jgi:hypothetical protein
MTEKRMPVIKVGRLDFVVKKNSDRHGALTASSEAVASLAVSDGFAEFVLLMLEKGRLLRWRFCSVADGIWERLGMPCIGGATM